MKLRILEAINLAAARFCGSRSVPCGLRAQAPSSKGADKSRKIGEFEVFVRTQMEKDRIPA